MGIFPPALCFMCSCVCSKLILHCKLAPFKRDFFVTLHVPQQPQSFGNPISEGWKNELIEAVSFLSFFNDIISSLMMLYNDKCF